MARKITPWWWRRPIVFGLTLGVILLGGGVVSASRWGVHKYESYRLQKEAKHLRELNTLSPADFGQVNPTPMLMETSVSHAPTGPITETADPIPAKGISGVITMYTESRAVGAQIYNGTDRSRYVWLVAWMDLNDYRHVRVDFRRTLMTPRSSTTLQLVEDRRTTRYQLVTGLPDEDHSGYAVSPVVLDERKAER